LSQSNRREHSIGFQIGATLQRTFGDSFRNVNRQLDATKKAVRNANQAWSAFGGRIVRVGLGIAGVATGVTAAVWRMADGIASTAASAYQNSSRLGMSIEGYQKLQFAMEQAGFGGLQLTSVMDGLNNTMARAAKTDEAWVAFGKQTGIDARKFAYLDAEQQLKVLANRYNEIQDPIKRAAFAQELFGSQAHEMQRVMALGANGIQEYMEQARRTGNVIDEETARQSLAYQNAKREFQASVSGIKTQLFSRLLPFFTQAFEGISSRLQSVDWDMWGERIVGWVQAAIPKVQEIAIAIGEFIARIWNGISAVTEFVGGWQNVAKIIGIAWGIVTAIKAINAIIAVAKVVQMAWNVVMALNPFVLIAMAIIAAIGLIIAAVILIKNNWEAIVEFFKRTGRVIADFFRNLWERITGFFQSAFNVVSNIWSAIVGFFRRIWDGIVAVFSFVINFYATIFRTAFNIVLNIWSAITGFFRGIWDGIVSIFSAVGGFFSNIFTGAFEGVTAIWSAITGFFTGLWDNILRGVRAFVDRVLDFFRPVTNLISSVGNFIGGIFGRGGNNSGEVSIPQYATGGIFTRPHIAQIAEAGAEAVVPLNNSNRAKNIWAQAGKMAGFLPNQSNTGSQPIGGGGVTNLFGGQGERRSLADVPMRAAAGGGYNMPINVNINISGNADGETVRGLQQAANNLTRQVQAAVQAMLPRALGDYERGQTRRSF
jgi:phage-related minor tail protein